ncbi:MAG: lysylphosphatidylglycerol synthase transmembrane domain-containing protein, partial [Solirubrobacterales bacterium]
MGAAVTSRLSRLADRFGITPRRGLAGIVAVALVALAVHFVLPAIGGLERTLDVLTRIKPAYIALGVLFSAVGLAGFAATFALSVRTHMDERLAERLSRSRAGQLALAAQGAGTVVTAAGAGTMAFAFWALRRAGMDGRDAARRMAAMFVLQYGVYLGSILVFGLLLGLGVLPGPNPPLMTFVPAGIAAGVIALVVAVAALPAAFEGFLSKASDRRGRAGRIAAGLLEGPAALRGGIEQAWIMARSGTRGVWTVVAAVGNWAGEIGVLWVCFLAFGETVPLAVLVLGFFIGMSANLLPLLPGGVGSVEAGLVAAFAALGEPTSEAVLAVLAYRLLVYWLPTGLELIALVRVQAIVRGWDDPAGIGEPGNLTPESPVSGGGPGGKGHPDRGFHSGKISFPPGGHRT